MKYLVLLREYFQLDPLDPIPPDSIITKEQYNALFEAFLSDQGDNPGKGLFGKWAWAGGKEEIFRNELHNLGVRYGKDIQLPEQTPFERIDDKEYRWAQILSDT